MEFENQNTPEVEEESQIEGAEAEVTEDEDSWPTKWGEDIPEDDDEQGESDDVTPEADQQADEQKPEENENAQQPAEKAQEQKPEEEDQFLELKHMDTIRKVNREEAKALAQKGLDYDRIRADRDAMQKDYSTLKRYESFLNELKGDFPTIDALITDTRARMMAEKDGISYADAVAKVNIMQQQAPAPQPVQQAQQNQLSPVDLFVQKYPGVKAQEIPQAVWDEVRRTGDLLGAYEHYQENKAAQDRISSLEKEINTLKQNQKNAARSAGSASSSGKTSGKSLAQQLWDEDDY